MWQHPTVQDITRKLLIVEDDPGIQSQLRWCFEDYDVIAATDRQSAINELRRHEPPVVLQDLGLPPDDEGVGEGFATLREILQTRANGDGLAVIGTADEVADHLAELGEAVGGDGFLFTGHVHPANVHRTLDTLVPALRRRCVLRTELGDGGLRANLLDF